MRRPGIPWLAGLYRRDDVEADADRFPASLPFVRDLDLRFERPVTFFVGENGSGKSTLLEALAQLADLPVAGGGAFHLRVTATDRTAGHRRGVVPAEHAWINGRRSLRELRDRLLGRS